MKNMSKREKVLLVAGIMAAILFIYWQMLLDPLISRVAKNRLDIIELSDKIDKYSQVLKNKTLLSTVAAKVEVKAREDQLSYVVSFLSKYMKMNDVKLISLMQSSSDNKIFIDLKYSGKYGDISKFFGTLSEFKTYFVIESCSMTNSSEKVMIDMRISTPYKP